MKLEDFILLEKAPIAAPKMASVLFSWIESNLDVKDGKRRGEKYDETGFYSVRVQPGESLKGEDFLKIVEDLVKSPKAKKHGIKYLRTAAMMHSAKFSSVLVEFGDVKFGIVVAAGANKGEAFEKDLLIKIDNLVAGTDNSEEAQKALDAIIAADPTIKRNKILTVVARSGKTQRSAGMSSDEVGKIIADIIIKMKGGSEHYISLKNATGSNVAQFGCSEAFNDDLSVNTSSDKWKKWMAPLGLDAKKIKAGLESYISGKAPSFATEEDVKKKIKPNSETYKMLESMWGTGYIYLREKNNGFEAFKVDHAYLADNLLKDLEIVRILYPSPSRKAIEVHLRTAFGGYKVRMRNKNDPKNVRPTIIQLEKTK